MGSGVGRGDGTVVGAIVGSEVGRTVGSTEGIAEGLTVGNAVGFADGTVGVADGTAEGSGVGGKDGDGVGRLVVNGTEFGACAGDSVRSPRTGVSTIDAPDPLIKVVPLQLPREQPCSIAYTLHLVASPKLNSKLMVAACLLGKLQVGA